MMILFWLFLVVFVLVCVLLCFLVLIQSDKGGGISGAIGGGLGGANSLLGTQDTANILTRGTMIFGSAFLVLCVVMSFLMSHQTVNVEKSLLQKRAESYSPSSVLDNKSSGLPIKSSSEQGASAVETSPGLPTVNQAPVTPTTNPSPAQTVPGAKSNAVPGGALPIKPSSDGGTK